ncbi:MAG: hypothetical protein ACK2UQ_04445, partial [Anaerolineae bacterium]
MKSVFSFSSIARKRKNTISKGGLGSFKNWFGNVYVVIFPTEVGVRPESATCARQLQPIFPGARDYRIIFLIFISRKIWRN